METKEKESKEAEGVTGKEEIFLTLIFVGIFLGIIVGILAAISE